PPSGGTTWSYRFSCGLKITIALGAIAFNQRVFPPIVRCFGISAVYNESRARPDAPLFFRRQAITRVPSLSRSSKTNEKEDHEALEIHRTANHLRPEELKGPGSNIPKARSNILHKGNSF